MDDLLDTAPCGFVSFTDEGTIVNVNATLLDMLGFAAGELLDRKVESILTVSTRIFYQTHFFPLLKLHGKAEEIFLSLRTKQQENIPVLANAVRRKHGEAYISHCVLIPVRQRRKYEDEILLAKKAAEEAVQSNEALITAKRELERHAQELDRQIGRLEQKNQELMRMSSILAHDLREPIRKMTMFTDILYRENRGNLTARGKQSLKKINAECAKMDQLITSIRQFISVDAAGEALGAVDLNEVVAAAQHQVSQHADAEGIQLQSETLPVVEGFRGQLVLLFYSLLDNAVKFRKPGTSPQVHIDSCIIQHNSFGQTKGRYRYIDFARITFTDHGIGFEKRYSNYVFQLLKKIDPDSPGLGLGLAVCKKVVEHHYGSISVESAPGKGTTFTILLPLKQ